MIELKSNQFWGNRSGFIHPEYGPIFKCRRATTTRKDNSGPAGWKARKVKSYKNLKLRRKNYSIII